MDTPDRHIVITGLMGVGKSTTGQALAETLGWPYVDSDADIEDLLGLTGRQLAAEAGIDQLHRIEAAVLMGALTRPDPHVIGAAASIVEDELARRALRRRAFAVRLGLSIEETIARQAAGEHRRPMSSAELTELARRREPLFVAVENLRLDADQSTDRLVAAIVNAFESSAT